MNNSDWLVWLAWEGIRDQKFDAVFTCVGA